jgi:hypothetical protein
LVAGEVVSDPLFNELVAGEVVCHPLSNQWVKHISRTAQ